MSKWGMFAGKENKNKNNNSESSDSSLATSGLFSNSSSTDGSNDYGQEKTVLGSNDALYDARENIKKVLGVCERMPKEPSFKDSDGGTTSVQQAVFNALGPSVTNKLGIAPDSPSIVATPAFGSSSSTPDSDEGNENEPKLSDNPS